MFEKPSGQAFVGSMSIKGVVEGMNGPDFCLQKQEDAFPKPFRDFFRVR